MAGISYNLNYQALGATTFSNTVGSKLCGHIQALGRKAYFENSDLGVHFFNVRHLGWDTRDSKALYVEVLGKSVDQLAKHYIFKNLPSLDLKDLEEDQSLSSHVRDDIGSLEQRAYVMFLQNIGTRPPEEILAFLSKASVKCRRDLISSMRFHHTGRQNLPKVICLVEDTEIDKVNIALALIKEDQKALEDLHNFAFEIADEVQLFLRILQTFPENKLKGVISRSSTFKIAPSELSDIFALYEPLKYLSYAHLLSYPQAEVDAKKREIIFDEPHCYLEYMFDGERLLFTKDDLLECVDIACREILAELPAEVVYKVLKRDLIKVTPKAYREGIYHRLIEIISDQLASGLMPTREAIILTLTVLNFSDRINKEVLSELKADLRVLPPKLLGFIEKWNTLENRQNRRHALKFAWQCFCETKHGLFPEVLWPVIGEVARLRNTDIIVAVEKRAKTITPLHLEKVSELLTFQKTTVSTAPFIIPFLFLCEAWVNPLSKERLFSIRDSLIRVRKTLKNRMHPLTLNLNALLPIFGKLKRKERALAQIDFALKQGSCESKSDALSDLGLLFEAHTFEMLRSEWTDEEMRFEVGNAWNLLTEVYPQTFPDYEAKYASTFGRLRVRRAFESYLVGIRGIRKSLKQFVISVLSGTIQEDRYHLQSIHLKRLNEEFPDLYKRWQQKLKPELASFYYKGREVFIDETDAWDDLFLSGTEVPASCQDVRAASDYNRALLAYVLDGKYKMVALRLEDESIFARSMLRLLFNKKGHPALFLECYYGPENGVFRRALLEKAKKIALDLDVSLYVGEGLVGTQAKKDEVLYSKDCPVLHEYVDALNSETNGEYAISELYQVPTQPIDYDIVTLYQGLGSQEAVFYNEMLHKAAFFLNEKLRSDKWGEACRSYMLETGDSFTYNEESGRGLITKPMRLLELLDL